MQEYTIHLGLNEKIKIHAKDLTRAKMRATQLGRHVIRHGIWIRDK